MPVLSMFYGIIIRMQRENDARHHIPHIHVVCAEEEVVLDLEGNVLEGDLKPSKMKLVQAWMEIHKEELAANWKLLSEGEHSFQIEPLR